MSRTLILTAAAVMLVCMIAGGAFADRLVLIPIGATLGTGGIRAEYANNSEGDGTAIWANLGIMRFEVEGARFMDYNGDDTDVFGLQASVIPETSFTPAIAIGVRNIADESSGLPQPYNERAFYAAATKTLPGTGAVPSLLNDIRIHGGVGTGGLSGVFFGADATVTPLGVRAAIEYDTENWNWAVSYGLGVIRAKLYNIQDDLYLGAAFSNSF